MHRTRSLSGKSGLTPATKKNNFPEIQTDSVRLPKLKSVWIGVSLRCHAISTLSAASVIAPASGPKSSTDANTNISDGEKCASTEGTLEREAPAQQRQRGEDQKLMRDAIVDEREDAVRRERDADRRDGGHVGAPAGE